MIEGLSTSMTSYERPEGTSITSTQKSERVVHNEVYSRLMCNSITITVLLIASYIKCFVDIKTLVHHKDTKTQDIN
jgi:hypothetical protein